jgi:CDP-paratose 2-epimerase
MKYEYLDAPRAGDHICYISDLTKMKTHYPQWDISKDLKTTLLEIHDAWLVRA